MDTIASTLLKLLRIANPQRVYIPHMQQSGTVRQSFGDGRLIGVMLDDGIFMQTSRAFTLPIEAPIYKEESLKSPLTNTSSLLPPEPIRNTQLTLF